MTHRDQLSLNETEETFLCIIFSDSGWSHLRGKEGGEREGGRETISMVVQLHDQYIQCTITFLRCVCGNVVSGWIVLPLYNFPVTFDPWGTLASAVEGREYC